MINKIQGYAKNIIPNDAKNNFELEGYINKVIDKVNENITTTNKIIANQNENANLIDTAKKLVPELKELNKTFGNEAREIKSQLSEIKTKSEYALQFDLVEGRTVMEKEGGSFTIMYPLEHPVNANRAGLPQLDDLYVQGNGSIIMKSKDGINYTQIVDINTKFGGSNYIKRQYTTSDKKHIVFNTGTEFSKTGNIELYAEDYSTKSIKATFNNIFYGIHGIDQNPFTKTLCYAEYDTGTPEQVSVYRAPHPFNEFTPTLICNAMGSDSPEVRHFHICAADPYVSGKWYVSSGDDPNQCHFWVSTDDGLTWNKVISSDARIRATQYYIDETHIYWTEDNPNGGFYRMNKNTYAIETIIANGILSGISYTVTTTPFGFLCIYDKVAQAIDPNNAYIYLIEYDTFTPHLLAKIPYTIGGSFKSRGVGLTSGFAYTDAYPTKNPFKLARFARMKVLKQELV